MNGNISVNRLINNGEILHVVRRALSKIDPRLVDHGERVGFIASMIFDQLPDRGELEFSKLYALCILHDIGAYKTDEIDDMVRFEVECPFDHALYGYLFLKNTSHLAEYAEALLYHHTDYSAPELRNCRFADYAEMIHLADRADILLGSAGGDLSPIRRMAGSKFNERYVDALFSAQQKQDFAGKIKSGEYREISAGIIDGLEISPDSIMDYLRLLVYAIDFRSPYTVTHTADTTLISTEIGKLLGLSEHEQQAIYLGAFLHDIGKIAIPHEILDKPGRLTPEEYAIVQRHIPEGEEILRGVIDDEICDIALRHHEKLDGSGYSRGLLGDVLTMPQRIVAVADITSALSQRRSYKEPFAPDVVKSLLNQMKQAGQLCPLVVDTVCSNYELIIGNIEASHDPVKVMYSTLIDEYEQLRTKHK